MATTYTVFSLGTVENTAGDTVFIDPIDGNTLAEDAELLEGLIFGGQGDGLATKTVTMAVTPGSDSLNSGVKGVYDQDNNPSETFTIDGVTHTFDAVAVYNATITYVDGTTAQITAVIFQDTEGNIYWAPEVNDPLDPSAVSDQAAIEAKPIMSLTLGTVVVDDTDGMVIDRFVSNVVPCYVGGTMIETATGDKPIEALKAGDLVVTHDGAPRAIRWIGSSTVQAQGKLAPVRITVGALGDNLPVRDLLVSRQHRMLVSSKVCERMFGEAEVLIPAIKLTALPGIYVDEMAGDISYFHLKLDEHTVIFAEGAPSETLLSGRFALAALGPEAIAELRAIFPDLLAADEVPARPIADGQKAKTLLMRHARNSIPCLPAGATAH